jgi:hypothetical protein
VWQSTSQPSLRCAGRRDARSGAASIDVDAGYDPMQPALQRFLEATRRSRRKQVAVAFPEPYCVFLSNIHGAARPQYDRYELLLLAVPRIGGGEPKPHIVCVLRRP